MTILPTAYLPSVAYFTALKQESCILDLHEHFIKRSERNRAHILTPTGVMTLTAHVQRGNRPQSPIRDLRLDYSKRWQHQHAMALRSAYKSSPYFDYYWDSLAPFYEREWAFLVDYNLAILEVLLRCLGMEAFMPHLSEHYLEPLPSDRDWRPKKQEGSPLIEAEPYVQVFSDRLPFEPNLSVIDLLFAEGPSAVDVLTRNRIVSPLHPADPRP